MAKTVDEGFKEFHGRLTPSATESQRAKNHRASIEACLKKNFDMNRFFRTGSFGHGTSIRNHSDVDYFASIPRNKLKNDSAYTLRDLRNVLDTRFPNTGVRVNSPAVQVPFGAAKSEWTEVVPADYIKKVNKVFKVYDMPDGSGGWMKSGPDAHSAYVTVVNKKLGYKVKPLLRFVKAWKYFRDVPVNSFYLEMRVAKYASGEKSIVFSIDMVSIFRILLNSELPAMRDPMGISGYIHPCSTNAKKKVAISKLQSALRRSVKAREAEKADNISSAFYWWNLVFSNHFPSYR